MGPPVVNYYESVAVCLRVFLKQVKPNQPTMSVDAAEIKRICDIYDWHGKGELDMYYFMDIFYALGMNLTKKTTVKYGQTDDVEKKFCKFDEVVSLVQQAVKEPEHTGNYHDYIELCKLYDKNENGTMSWLNSRLSCLLWVMKSPRMTAPSFWKLWLIPRMKMVFSLTPHSSTNCAERHKWRHLLSPSATN